MMATTVNTNIIWLEPNPRIANPSKKIMLTACQLAGSMDFAVSIGKIQKHSCALSGEGIFRCTASDAAIPKFVG